MNTEDKAKLARKISAEIQSLSAYVGHEPEEYAHTPETDLNVKIEALAVQALDQHTLAAARTKISSLRRTLATIDDENFGFCADCGTPIPLERLLIVPDTDRCPECAT